jgi:hypothetical protein
MGIDHHRSEPCEGFVAPVGVDLSEEFQRIVGLTVGAMEVLETKLQGYLSVQFFACNIMHRYCLYSFQKGAL